MDNWESEERHPKRNIIAASAVIIFHVFILYAAATGLGEQIMEMQVKPVFAKLVDEFKPVPPPPMAEKSKPSELPKKDPKPIINKPKVKAPPISYAPKAEVHNNEESKEGIRAVGSEKPLTDEMSTSLEQPQQGGEISHVEAKISGDCDKPEYPRSSLRNNEEGVVDVKLKISDKGDVLDAEIVRSSGFPDLDKATLRAWSLCHFTPAMHEGKVVESTTIIEYIWKIKE